MSLPIRTTPFRWATPPSQSGGSPGAGAPPPLPLEPLPHRHYFVMIRGAENASSADADGSGVRVTQDPFGTGHLGTSTGADVLRLAKEKPLPFGSAGVGSAHQIAGALLAAKAGIALNHVPFQGGGPAVQALAGGHIDMSFATLPSLTGIAAGGYVLAFVVALAGCARALAWAERRFAHLRPR